jgi:hypothetical protein
MVPGEGHLNVFSRLIASLCNTREIIMTQKRLL